MPLSLFTLLARYTPWLLAGIVCSAAAASLWLSRYQPIEWDLAMLHYIGFLVNEKGLVLYRDIYENNLPGVFLLHALIGQWLGYEAMLFRVLDTLVLLSLAITAWLILSPVSRPAAVVAPWLFALLYLGLGGSMASFQRDYLGILPIAAGLAWLLRAQSLQPARTALLLGALCALSCSLKPNYFVAGIALYVLLYLRLQPATVGAAVRLLLLMGCGFVPVFSIPLAWAARHGDYAAFLEIYRTFTPIYVTSRTDLYHYSSKAEQLQDLARMQGDYLTKSALFALPGLAWAWWQQRGNTAARQVILFLGITTFAFNWYELIAGKFWFAHLLPYYFWNILCFSLLLTPCPQPRLLPQGLALAACLATTAISLPLAYYSTHQMQQRGYTSDYGNARSFRIAAYLRQHLQPGDTVQAIDGSGDGQGSLLLARATPATRFLEDIPLYMQPDAPATQALRREFVSTLAARQPAYIVHIENFFHPAGGNRLKEFRELSAFIDSHYDVVHAEDSEFIIFRRKDLTSRDTATPSIH